MKKTYNRGIIGLGHIAHKFAHDLMLAENANLYAVASRSVEKAEEFAERFNSDKSYGTYEALATDPKVDIVYIATPHVFHSQQSVMCLDAGKAVLCEKAFGMNASEVEFMINKARENNQFLMEALWTRFIPGTETILDIIKNGMIGELKSVKADFGFKAKYEPEKRLFSKKLGGGSLLDIGIYPVFLSLLTLGVPDDIKALALMSESGVDNSCGMVFTYSDGRSAILNSELSVDTATEAWLFGDRGALKMHTRFHHTKQISHYMNHSLQNSYRVDYIGNGYFHEILEVMKCLDEGKRESDELPLSFSLNLIKTLDRVREEIGLSY